MKRLFIGLQIPENVIQTLGELPTDFRVCWEYRRTHRR